MKVRIKPILIAIAISAGLALLNSLSVVVSYFRTPTGSTYLGTIHYWEDYLFYLNHFFQGAHGAWLTVNRYTPEPTAPSIIYWCNILLGKLGRVLFLSPPVSYYLSLVGLAFLTLFLSYKVQERIFNRHAGYALTAFLMTNLSTSLINYVKSAEGPMIFWPFQIWRTPHFAFDRLGGAPHQLIQTILAYLFFLAWFFPPHDKKKAFLYPIIIIILLTTLNPIQSGVYIALLWLTEITFTLLKATNTHQFPNLETRIPIPRLISTSLSFALTFLYTNSILSTLPHLQSKLWEASQHSYTTIPFLFFSIGPVFLLAVLGIVVRIKHLTRIEFFGLTGLITGYVVFMSPIPKMIGFSNLRVLFPASHVFWGVFGTYGVLAVSRMMKRFVRIPQSTIHILVVGIFLLTTLPSLVWEISWHLPKKETLIDPTVYLPNGIMESMQYLAKTKPYDAIVLAGPAAHMDTIVPAFTGHTVYSGHMLTTIRNDEKQTFTRSIYSLTLPQNTAQTELKSRNITYILFTTYDGDRSAFEAAYPFLKKEFETAQSSVYKN